uniref:Uncharacterized protein n=1 Tax=Aegilops tauschii subsp. strangulata TaxID=200361 RepID=A0A453KZA3_AEGTS
MTLTHRAQVILESLRMASIISFTFREAVADVEYKGFLIPKGWKVMPLFRNIHHSPDYFQDPQKFDPSRFKVAPRPSTFTPFGSGVHACPGNELAKLEMLVLIHHLVTGYRCVPPSLRLHTDPPYIPICDLSLWTRTSHGWCSGANSPGHPSPGAQFHGTHTPTMRRSCHVMS